MLETCVHAWPRAPNNQEQLDIVEEEKELNNTPLLEIQIPEPQKRYEGVNTNSSLSQRSQILGTDKLYFLTINNNYWFQLSYHTVLSIFSNICFFKFGLT